jgi:2'-5' RNA ligase
MFESTQSFASLWTRFRASAYVLRTWNRDYHDWRRGRLRYFAWVVPVENAALTRRHAAASRLLRRYMLNPGARAPHVTIHVAGFVCERPVHDDDISRSDILRQVKMLKTRRHSGLSLCAGGLNSFRSSPFIEVGCRSGELEAIRRDLATIVPEQRFATYTPHVTVGVYNAPYATRDPASLICRWRSLPVLEFVPASIDLVSIDAREPAGSLQVEERVAIPRPSYTMGA